MTACGRTQGGFQLLELLIALAVIAVLMLVAVPIFTDYRDKANKAMAGVDIRSIEQAIERFYEENHGYPDNLNQVNMGGRKDPWNRSYRYLRIAGASPPNSQVRKDKNLVPINTDYDLYSVGKDGASIAPLTAASSRDDIVRANNGRYVGLAADY